MEQLLINLTAISKRSLLVGENLCSEANELVEDCRTHLELIEILYPKTKFLSEELAFQLKILESFGECFRRQTTSLSAFVQDQEEKVQDATSCLEEVFFLLKNIAVDDGIIRNAIESGIAVNGGKSKLPLKENSENMTLFDYIDEQSVATLKQNTHLELTYLKELLKESLDDYTKLSGWLEEFNGLNNSSITFEESGFTYSIETRQRQEDETNRMADVLLSLARHYDQVSSVLKVCQSQSEEEFNIDISVLEKDTDEIPSVLEDLEESLQMIEAISEDVKIRNQLYASVQNELVNLLTKIDECSSEITKIVENIKSIKLEFSRRRVSLEGFSDELYNLVAWYHEFSSAYHHLVVEIDRRRQVEKYHQEVAEDYSKALQELHLGIVFMNCISPCCPLHSLLFS
ncbi:hypothetical protein K7432_007130 [Basidiobolus ranarum]|uniref:Autophagy-related protein 17 n=1 Tax=Basidiobolus ranarum TaxID=34480 RepID=A0ABR2WTW3_9FUNG